MWEAVVADQEFADTTTERLAESIRRALSLVGPAENGTERIAGEPTAEEPAV